MNISFTGAMRAVSNLRGRPMALAFCAMTLIGALAPAPAQAQEPARQLFGNTDLPSASAPRVHGFYSGGCIAGAVAMPVDGPNWQAMRLERNRRWGHPELIALIQRLADEAVDEGWPGLLVGDIAQPRGGPMLTGHRSHQTGLDADLWLTKMPDRRLTPAERRDMSAISVLKPGTMEINPQVWTPAHARLLQRAASYDEIERVLVNPGIKKKMCELYGDDPANDPWMIKLRPVRGHHYHFHIRMVCPDDSPDCRPQKPVPTSGNDCGAPLDWWFNPPPPPKDPKPVAKPRPRRDTVLADLPDACGPLLRAPQPASESLATYSAQFDRSIMMASAVPSTAPDPALGRIALPSAARLPIPTARPE
ncbi:penicillin-insensitive murein endopeptidase [Roseitalea sp. MMSF_3504]|nr:penicillin-insensitive murein endopeptidase [Roseitalea sp. MMSF_3504]